MKKVITTVVLVLGILTLSACNDVEENYRPDLENEENAFINNTDETSEINEADETAEISQAPSAASSVKRNVETAAVIGGIPEIKAYSEINGDTLIFTVDNIFSEGGYYAVSVSGERTAGNGTEINGETYGNFRLTLEKNGAEIDHLDIEVPDGERFLIMESVLDNRTYGCSVISNKRDFSADDLPDIVQLDLYKPNELEIPQYGRYFAVFGGRLAELPVYENGVETAPLGTHLEPREKGRMIQRLCVFTPSGKSLMVKRYEYIYNVEQRRLDKSKI